MNCLPDDARCAGFSNSGIANPSKVAFLYLPRTARAGPRAGLGPAIAKRSSSCTAGAFDSEARAW